MNILFVNYGDFTTNSLNHIGGFASVLADLGHACAIAVPHGLETLSHVDSSRFYATTFADALAQPRTLFPDGRAATVIHAWTPRELVRKFVLAYQRTAAHPARLVIHLEDNERFLLERFTGKSFAALCAADASDLAALLPDNLSHPLRHQSFLALADGVTVIEPRLHEFVPPGIPLHVLRPGVDFQLYQPQPPAQTLRAELKLPVDERVIVYTGGTTFANEDEVRALYEAVALLNRRGQPTRLVRTGFNAAGFLDSLSPETRSFALELGFVPKEQLPRLLALADVLVQPGVPGPFNDYRLPSKLPEFLALGKPVLLPATNIGLLVRAGADALLLHDGTAEEIALRCAEVFASSSLAGTLGAAARRFAQTHFDLAENTTALATFYRTCLDRSSRAAWPILLTSGTSEIDLFAAQLQTPLTPASAASAADDWALLRALVRLVQQELTHDVHAQLTAAVTERDALRAREPLTQQHLHNIETGLTTAHQHIANLEPALHAAQQHIANIEAALQSTQDHVANLESALATTRQHTRNLEWLLAATRADRDRSAQRAATAEAERAEHRRTLDRSRHDLAALREELAARVRKIELMQRSFSWQATAPLRALRRRFLDSRRRETPLASALPARDPHVASAIDEPTDWMNLAPTGLVRGWVLNHHGRRLVAVRLRAGSALFSAHYGSDRPDVGAAFPHLAAARRSGFSVTYTLPPQSTPDMILEALGEDGRWTCFHATRAVISTVEETLLRRDYATWVRRFDSAGEADAALRARLDAAPPPQPLVISVLLPTYNTPEPWLRRAIKSVRQQIYPHWQLCIADDASTAPHVRSLLEQAAREDERIALTFREQNGHISAASNSALALATGDYVALLDHDDELAPSALAEIALAVAACPNLAFLYSDEDKIDEDGRRFDPYFKPGWNPDLLLGQNYTCHLSVFRTALLRSIGGFREGYEGSQDWDLTLRATAELTPAQIHHVPRILYHWRAIAGSTALQTGEKNYAFEAARRALVDHCSARGLDAALEPIGGHYWRLRRPVPKPAPRVSIIVPTRNGEPLLRLCLSSLFAKTSYPHYEVIVVNNRSDDPATLRYFDELRTAGVTVLDYDAPFNYSAVNNTAVRAAHGELLAFLNNDIEIISPDWLDEMVSHAVRPEIGCVGAMLYYPDDTIQHAGIVLGVGGRPGTPSVAGHAFKCATRGSEGQRARLRLVQNYSAVTAACMVMRRAVFDEVGGFNETDLPVAFNDVDLCLRVQAAGYRNLWTPFAELYHHESATRGLEDTPEKQARFAREVAYMRAQWAEVLDADPAYNPNLTAEHEDFSLAFPPRTRA
ncbi:glycosyltransferase [Horticoccus luteus]|uniref:Glycosyltransferase n=1 Tax=Horticoccus luteus TaxID=2862869 RepID=A0A8F9TWX1_9BACT|nr:glycosyltransferase [Horticoccus luteus]QYM79768.1 glycosyltransferase [Horticoccus luteus]